MANQASIAPELVQQFVGNAHGDLEKVKQLLEQEPGLLNAAWDWGGGDWETALGAAAHVGRKDIANYLLARGARMDIFAAAMLGELEIVRSMLDYDANLINVPGPHGFSLLHHAEAGGPEAEPIVRLIQNTRS